MDEKDLLDVPDKAGTIVVGYYKCWNDNPMERGYAVAQGKAVDVRNSKEYDKNGALQSRASNNLQSNNVVRVSIGERGDNIGTTKGTEVLCILRKTYGEEAVHKWCAAILERIQQAKVLRQGVHEESVPAETTQGNELDDGPLPCEEHIAKWLLRDLRKQQERGCTSQGWESAEQQQGKLNEGVQELPQQNSSSAQSLCDMWRKGEGIWLLRETLSAFQEMGKSICGEKRECRYAVRRLTPIEAERLQGLPDNFTLIDDKSCSDSARYKALGNGMSQTIPDWIMRRLVEEVNKE